MSAKKKRAPCPFCGSEDATVAHGVGAVYSCAGSFYLCAVVCCGCGARGPTAKSARGALRRWNSWADGTSDEADEVRKVLLDAVDLYKERSR